jgi:glutamate-1-semialdehyde 2,1-aminomutase
MGRKDIMKEMENIFFSGTFGGETLSLAAAKASIEKIVSVNLPEKLSTLGTKLTDGLRKLKHHDMLTLCGHPSWSFALLKEQKGYSAIEVETLFVQEMHKRGILLNGGHNLNYAHTDDSIETLINCYDEVLAVIKSGVDNQNLAEKIECELLQPIFKVR